MLLDRKFVFCLATLTALLLLVWGCAQQQGAPTMPKRIVDLSPTITEDLPVRIWGHKSLNALGFRDSTRFEHIGAEEPIYFVNSYITLFNHAGPHHDAPSHMEKGAKSTDQFPLDEFFGRARVLDFRSKPTDEPLLLADFQDKNIQPGDIVIAFVGYTPPTGPDELPSYAYLSGEAAEYLASIPVKAFATDALSGESIRRVFQLMEEGATGYENVLPVHYAFLSREIPIIEQLVNLESLVGEENIVFVGFPLKIKDGNAGPLRAAALVY